MFQSGGNLVLPQLGARFLEWKSLRPLSVGNLLFGSHCCDHCHSVYLLSGCVPGLDRGSNSEPHCWRLWDVLMMGNKEPFNLWCLKWDSKPYCHVSVFKCRYTSVLGAVAFRSPHGLTDAGSLWGWCVPVKWAAKCGIWQLWLQLDMMSDHLTPKAPMWEHLRSIAFARFLNFVNCSKENIDSEFNPKAFCEKLSDICYKDRLRKSVGTVIFLLCESACSNGFWRG